MFKEREEKDQRNTKILRASLFSKTGFSNMWTMNFQMFKLVLDKAEDQIANNPCTIKKAREFQKTI